MGITFIYRFRYRLTQLWALPPGTCRQCPCKPVLLEHYVSKRHNVTTPINLVKYSKLGLYHHIFSHTDYVQYMW